MGIPCSDVHFSGPVPAFDAIYHAICEVEGTDIHAVIDHDPSCPSDPSLLPDAASRRSAVDSLTLYGSRKGRLRILVTWDDHEVYMSGAKGLLKSSCLALEKLGGTVVEPAKTRSFWSMGWREWLWTVVCFPFSLLAMLLVGLLLLIYLLVAIPIVTRSRLRERRTERKLRSRLASEGRFLPWFALETMLKSGTGTLIIEHFRSEAFIREWWTADDLVGRSPVPLPASPILLPEGDRLTSLREYAEACAARYTETTAGAARLTEVPVRELKGSRRKLSQKYPRARIVILFRCEWDAGQSLLYGGGPETSTGGSAESVVRHPESGTEDKQFH
jgi:hypothetical protein